MSSTIYHRHKKTPPYGPYKDGTAELGIPKGSESSSLSSASKTPSAFKDVAWDKLTASTRLRVFKDEDSDDENHKSRRSYMTRKLQSCRRFTTRLKHSMLPDVSSTTLSVPALINAEPKHWYSAQHQYCPNVSSLALFLGLFVFIPCSLDQYSKRSIKQRGRGRPMSLDALMQSPIDINGAILPDTDVHRPIGPVVPLEANDDESGDTEGPDYANLTLFFLKDGGGARNIFRRVSDRDGHVYDEHDFEDEEDFDFYYAFDDDGMRRTVFTDRKENACRRQAGHRLFFPTCNTMHEIGLLEHESNKYLSYGYWRDVYKLKNTVTEGVGTEVVLKIIKKNHKYNHETYEYTRMDALVSERLTASPHIVSVYGVCGVALLTEFIDGTDMEEVARPNGGYRQQGDLHDSMDVDPQNSLTPLEKLKYAISMAEAIAILHGFKDGIIVHGDVQLPQFLLSKDGRMKLNDFNRAEFMLWDDTTQDYCRYRNGVGYGNYRAPEEYNDLPLNEKVDVWSTGVNIYSLLTGLWPFYDIYDDVVIRGNVIAGELLHPFVDERYKTRSFIEGKLVEVLTRCWESDPEKRADIFEVVQLLREALAQYEQMNR